MILRTPGKVARHAAYARARGLHDTADTLEDALVRAGRCKRCGQRTHGPVIGAPGDRPGLLAATTRRRTRRRHRPPPRQRRIVNRTASAIAAVAIPDPGPALDVERMNVAAVLARLERIDDLQEADEYRLRAQALASYLANRLDPGPANRIANMAAVRIGELLGPAELGKPSHGTLSLNAIKLDPAVRSHFRLMARYRSIVEESAHLSRTQVLDAIGRRRDEERRLAQLPADLADRVVSESDPITLAEAETA